MGGLEWRRIAGWLLIVLGAAVALIGLIAILGSGSPGVTNPADARTGGVAFIVFGGLVLGGGWLLLLRARRKSIRGPLDPLARAGAARRNLRIGLISYASGSLLLVVVGVVCYFVSLGLDGTVHSLQTAAPCPAPAGDANCYELRPVTLTGVDVSQTRQGEQDRVRFTDSGHAHQLTIQPGSLDSSVLRTGASGVAKLWEGRYTNLQVSGIDFVTTDNPVGQRDEFRFIALLGVVVGLVTSAGIPLGYRARRRREQALEAVFGAQPVAHEVKVPVTYPGLPLVIRPRPLGKRVSPWMWLAALAFLAFTYLSVIPYGTVAASACTGAAAVLIGAFAVWQVLVGRNAGVFVDDVSFGVIDAFGRRKTWPRSSAARVETRIMLDPGRRRNLYPIVLVVGPDGRAVTRIMPRLYEADAMPQLAAALRVPYDDSPVPVTARELAKEVPASTPWMARHSYLAGAAIAIGLIGVGVAVLMVTAGPAHR